MNVFPFGVFYWSPAPSAPILVPITLLFTIWIVSSLSKTKSNLTRLILGVGILWNMFVIYLDLFYITLPVSNELLLIISIAISAVMVFILKAESKFSSPSVE